MHAHAAARRIYLLLIQCMLFAAAQALKWVMLSSTSACVGTVLKICALLLDSDCVLPGRSVGNNKENRRVMACWQGGVSSLSTLAVFKCVDVTLTNQQRKQRLPWFAAGSCRYLHGHSSIITQLTKVALTNQYLLPPLMDRRLGNCCMCIIGCLRPTRKSSVQHSMGKTLTEIEHPLCLVRSRSHLSFL